MKEKELWFYALVEKPQGLDMAVSTEIHEQWEFNIPGENGAKKKARVRATTKDGQVAYTETIKIYEEGAANHVLSCLEPTIEITEEYFRAWIKAFGTTGVNKIRYTFVSKEVTLEAEGQTVTLPEVKYEVDVLINEAGQRSKWCKIDIEIDGILAYLAEHHPDIKKFDTTVKLSSLPFQPTNAFSGDVDDEAHREAVKTFWSKFSIQKKD